MMTRKTLALALLASLAVNLFLAGVLTRTWSGHADRCSARGDQHSPDQHPRHKPSEMGDRPRAKRDRGPPDLELLRQMIHIMGREDPRVQQVLADSRKQMKASRKELAQARNQVLSALTADPYRSEALEGALLELRTHGQTLQEVAQNHVVALAEKLSTEERAQLRNSPTLVPPRGRVPR